jgi:hypothetical protein
MNHNTVGFYRWTGVLGLLATAVFLAKTFLPMPDKVHLLLCMSFGPLVVAGAPGMARFMKRGRMGLLPDAAGLFAIVAGAFHLAMVCVQTTTIMIMRDRIVAADEAAKAALRPILSGVFTVQLGLCFCWDLFIALATLLFSIALIRSGGKHALLGTLGLCIGGTFLALKLWTYPIPPGEAGLFDLGPGVGAWYMLFSLVILLSAKIAAQEARVPT